jgi:hypothetical protein
MSPAAACSASGVNAPGGVEADDAWVPEGADGEDVAEDVAAAVVVGCDVPHAVLMPATAAATHTRRMAQHVDMRRIVGPTF